MVAQLCVSRGFTYIFHLVYLPTRSFSLVNFRIRWQDKFHFRPVSCAIACRSVSQSTHESVNLDDLNEGTEEREHAGRERVGRRERKFDLWKVKQKRFTRHITNLIRKEKASQHSQLLCDIYIPVLARARAIGLGNMDLHCPRWSWLALPLP